MSVTYYVACRGPLPPFARFTRRALTVEAAKPLQIVAGQAPGGWEQATIGGVTVNWTPLEGDAGLSHVEDLLGEEATSFLSGGPPLTGVLTFDGRAGGNEESWEAVVGFVGPALADLTRGLMCVDGEVEYFARPVDVEEAVAALSSGSALAEQVAAFADRLRTGVEAIREPDRNAVHARIGTGVFPGDSAAALGALLLAFAEQAVERAPLVSALDWLTPRTSDALRARLEAFQLKLSGTVERRAARAWAVANPPAPASAPRLVQELVGTGLVQKTPAWLRFEELLSVYGARATVAHRALDPARRALALAFLDALGRATDAVTRGALMAGLRALAFDDEPERTVAQLRKSFGLVQGLLFKFFASEEDAKEVAELKAAGDAFRRACEAFDADARDA